jgi:catechol 2,3-dioxygenase-like lactoylglutathione lyase family enzyme
VQDGIRSGGVLSALRVIAWGHASGRVRKEEAGDGSDRRCVLVQVTRILHAAVNAKGSLDETRSFYAGTLGLEEAPRPEIPGIPGHWLSVGDAQVHLIGAAPAGEGIDPTGHHVCLAVADLAAAVAELEAADVAYARASQGPVVQIWIVDPAGNTVELQQDPAAVPAHVPGAGSDPAAGDGV